MALKGTPLESFFVELGFDIDTSDLSKFEKDLKGARESVLSIATIAAAAAAAIGLFVFSIAESVDALGDFAEQEKISVEAIQEFGHAAQLNGSSVDAIKSSIQGLNRVTGEAINGLGRGKKAFETFGLQAKDSEGNVKTFDSLLLEISGKMQSMSRQAAISMAEKLGLDRSLIPLLMKGKSAIEEYRKEARELGITSQEDADLAGKFTDEYARLKMAFLSTARGIAISLMPQILNAITLTKNWIVQNRAFIKNSIARTLEFVNIVLGTMWDYLYRVIAALGSFASWVGKSKFALYVLIGALGVIAKLAFYDTIKQIASGFMFLAKMITLTNIAALATTAIIGLLILAIGLIIDDFINWREGNDSLIGDLVKDFPQVLTILNMIADGASAFVDYWLDLWSTISGPTSELFKSIFALGSLLATTLWPIIKLVFQGWFEIIKILLPIIISFVATVLQYLVELVSFLIYVASMIITGWTLIFSSLETLGKGIFNFFVGIFTGIRDKFMEIVSWIVKKASQFASVFGINANIASSLPASNNSTSQTTSPLNTTGGILGNTNTSNSSQVNSTVIQGTTIQINSPDPTKAGESVRLEMERMNRTSTRNNQSAVAL